LFQQMEKTKPASHAQKRQRGKKTNANHEHQVSLKSYSTAKHAFMKKSHVEIESNNFVGLVNVTGPVTW